MDDSSGVLDSFDHALSNDERAALAAWAESDPPDGFADAVLAAWGADTEPSVRPRREGPRSSDRRGVLGIGAAVAAAAAVLLMARVMPASPDEAGAEACDHAPLALAGVAPQAEPFTIGPGAPSVLGVDAVAVLTRHCTPCHDGTDPGAQPAALQVFDLQQPRWWSMADDQLREASLRIEQLGSATDDERRSMAAFVHAELSRRGRSGAPSRAALRKG